MERITIPEGHGIKKVILNAGVGVDPNKDHRGRVSILLHGEDVTESRHSWPNHIGAVSRVLTFEEGQQCEMVVHMNSGGK